jgi:hypothetical protein
MDFPTASMYGAGKVRTVFTIIVVVIVFNIHHVFATKACAPTQTVFSTR